MHARAKDALDDAQDMGDVRPRELTSEQKVEQYTTRWNGVHHRIDKVLEEIEASLEGDPIDSLEVLNVKEYRLMQIKESLKESASLMNSIINEDPEQTNALLGLEDARALQTVSKISACEECLATFRATINAGRTSNMGVAVSAITESTAALSTRPAPIRPRLEKRPLPAFKSGKLRDYPTFKSDWVKAVDGYFKPSKE